MPYRRSGSSAKTILPDPSPKSRLLPYRVYKPGGNTTALVTESIPASLHAEVANRILGSQPDIEQVGFIQSPLHPGAQFRLRMMGGEFCLNAARCAAFYWATQSKSSAVVNEVSGFDQPVVATVEGNRVTIQLDKGFYINSSKKRGVHIVDLHGIRHIVTNNPINEKDARQLIRTYKNGWDAVGVIASEVRGQIISIDPLIWVRRTDSLIRETACGSGSVAAAIVAHNHHGNQEDFDIVQPSGQMYDVHLACNKTTFTGIRVCGMVEELGRRYLLLPARYSGLVAKSRE